MKRRILIAAAAALALSGIAQAHTHLKSSTPADKAVLSTPPTRIMLHFSEPTRLTALSIEKEGSKEQQVLSVFPKEPSADVSVPTDSLTPGKYVVKWRAIGADNHVMSGSLQFTVSAK